MLSKHQHLPISSMTLNLQPPSNLFIQLTILSLSFLFSSLHMYFLANPHPHHSSHNIGLVHCFPTFPHPLGLPYTNSPHCNPPCWIHHCNNYHCTYYSYIWSGFIYGFYNYICHPISCYFLRESDTIEWSTSYPISKDASDIHNDIICWQNSYLSWMELILAIFIFLLIESCEYCGETLLRGRSKKIG